MEIATEGHNVLILGPAGTGKSYVVKKIAQTMKSSGKRVGVTGTTGMAASLIQGVTVHKFFALRDGRYSNEELTNKILTDVNYHDVKTRILSIDCVIIDEISMLSWKLLEQIEYVCRHVRGVSNPFGGIQMVLAGDFFQLKPVANQRYGDPGDLVISNTKFRDLIPHHIVLKKVYRQSEEKLITAIHELSRGLASESTIEFLKTLERPLVTGVLVRLFSQNYDVDICNSDNLLELTG
ncbi:uncharacterized protein LOC134243283 [Saccostrea cucullata]|uniref:uncharacterized protein LOC134243283 n=1 Tax=Saccostrea cuccullata TaxID=36930 RepID=UPI002ED3B52F